MPKHFIFLEFQILKFDKEHHFTSICSFYIQVGMPFLIVYFLVTKYQFVLFCFVCNCICICFIRKTKKAKGKYSKACGKSDNRTEPMLVMIVGRLVLACCICYCEQMSVAFALSQKLRKQKANIQKLVAKVIKKKRSRAHAGYACRPLILACRIILLM